MTDHILKVLIGGVTEYHDATGVSTTDGTETLLFVNTTSQNMVSSAGYIDLGQYSAGEMHFKYTETAGYAGTLKLYGAGDAAGTGAAQIGASQTITASGGDPDVIISSCPRFFKATITRSTSNITAKYWFYITRKATI